MTDVEGNTIFNGEPSGNGFYDQVLCSSLQYKSRSIRFVKEVKKLEGP